MKNTSLEETTKAFSTKPSSERQNSQFQTRKDHYIQTAFSPPSHHLLVTESPARAPPAHLQPPRPRKLYMPSPNLQSFLGHPLGKARKTVSLRHTLQPTSLNNTPHHFRLSLWVPEGAPVFGKHADRGVDLWGLLGDWMGDEWMFATLFAKFRKLG